MGYYDTQKVAPNAGGQPYNVRDILLATQGITGGVDKLVTDAGADRKAQQQIKANAYVSELLGKATPENYQHQLLQAGTMAPYASPELMSQVKDTRGQMQYNQGVATHAKERLYDETRWTKQDKETVRMNEEQIRHQGVMEGQSQQQINNQIAQMKQSYALGMAGIAEQAKGREANTAMQQQWHKDQIEMQRIGMDSKKIENAMTSLNANLDASFAQGTGIFNWASIDEDKKALIKSQAGNYAMKLMLDPEHPMTPQAAANTAATMVMKQQAPSYTSSSLLNRVQNVFK